jgi:hypothetical protein
MNIFGEAFIYVKNPLDNKGEQNHTDLYVTVVNL